VCASKRESRGSVIEGGACPVGGAVTGLTSRRETSLHVTRIVRAVVIGLMALNARRRSGQAICPARAERGVVALRALQRGMSSVKGEAGRRMIEGSAAPTRGGVALLASCREICLCMARTGRPIEIRLMAGHARRRSGQVICAARAERRVVALGALQRGMRSVQSEAGAGVVEGRAGPVRRAVALLARSWETRLHVVGIRRAVEIGLMALNATSGIGQVICPARAERGVVALGALKGDVRSVQSEAGAGVVEGRARPCRGRVALLARGRETRLHVVGIRRAVEIGLVALNATSGIGEVICPARAERGVVALGTLQRGMRSVQRETSAGMVEGCTIPIRGGVALLARGRETSLHMVRTGRAVEIGLMAGHATSGIGQVICPTRAERGVVALGALKGDVGSVQGKARGRMVERATGPVRGVVALLADRGES